MCLDKLTPENRPVRYGYKVFARSGEGLTGDCFGGGPYITGVRYRAKEVLLASEMAPAIIYMSGFHTFHYKVDALGWAVGGDEVWEVKLGGTRVVGVQSGYPITVAGTMELIEQVYPKEITNGHQG